MVSTDEAHIGTLDVTVKVYLKDYPGVFTTKNFNIIIDTSCEGDEIIIDQDLEKFLGITDYSGNFVYSLEKAF